MQALALITDRDYYTRAANEDCINGGPRTRTKFGYDLASRLISLGQDVAGTAQDVAVAYQYTLASQLYTRSSNNALYDWLPAAASTGYAPDGLNRYSTVAGATFTYDARANLTSDGTNSYTYDVENRLLTASGPTAVTLVYDPLGRLQSTTAGATATQYLYSGTELVAELDGSGNVLRRYVHGPGTDDPIVWYEGPTLATRNYLHADERGSVIATTNSSGSASLYLYGPYGETNNWTGSRFRYTGQTAIPEAQLYYYKARIYSPTLGRFLQTDPVGTQDDLNLYAYAGGDPVNGEDPTGELCVSWANGSDDFCSRSRVYAAVNADNRVSSKTSFFAAAAIVTNTLGGAPQSDFQHKLSADLEKANLDRANEIRAGTRYATGSIEEHNRDFVHFEQTHVQTALDGLQASDPEGYKSNVDAANAALNGKISSLAKLTDSSFASAVAATRASLGHAIDFASQKDREALGNTIAAGAAKAALTCIGSRVGACGY